MILLESFEYFCLENCLLWLFQIKHVFIQEQLKWFWNFASLATAFILWNILYTKWTAATSLEAAGCFSWKRFRFVGGSSSWNDSKADKGYLGSVTSVVKLEGAEYNRQSWLLLWSYHLLLFQQGKLKSIKSKMQQNRIKSQCLLLYFSTSLVRILSE